MRKLYFGVKRISVPTVSTVSFDFSLKRLLNQQFAPLKGFGGATVSDKSTVSFSPFCIFYFKNTLFLILLVVKVYLFYYNCIVIKKVLNEVQKSH